MEAEMVDISGGKTKDTNVVFVNYPVRTVYVGNIRPENFVDKEKYASFGARANTTSLSFEEIGAGAVN